MQDLISYMGNLGFNLSSPTLDGKIHRFGEKNNSWFIGWQNHSLRSGEVYIVAQFGNWRDGIEYNYRSQGVKLSREDNEAIQKQIAAKRKIIEQEKLERQIDGAIKSEKFIAQCKPGSITPYLQRKQIDQPYGSLTVLDAVGELTVIPIVDTQGKIWNYQRIFPDGEKKFSYGCKIDGCFHVIGPPIVDEAIICEGFATGSSIFMALGIPVVVAFNAQNLPKVAVAIRSAYPEAKIIIAGDNDHKTEGNPGLKAAETAAAKSGASTVYPQDIEGTDFNDLHVEKGLDAVRDYFHSPDIVASGFVPLGYLDNVYYFFSFVTKDVIPISTFADHQFYSLARREYWEALYLGGKGGIDWGRAKDALIDQCQKAGVFDVTRIRGTGVWLDSGRTVVNSGHELLVNNKPTSQAQFKSWYVYKQTSNRFPIPEATPLTLKECRWLIDLCTSLNWSEPKQGYLIAGWLAIARIAGALPVRPHIWLTGPAGSGKSTVMENLICNVLGNRKGKLFVQGASTEAGIRQAMSCSSIPLIFDEFETTDQNSKDRISSIVQLLRQAWSISSGGLLKGSGNGTAVNYNVGFASLVSSIRVNIQNDADKSRFTICELKSNQGQNDHWQRIQKELSKIDEDFGDRLFLRSITQVENILKSYKVFQKVIADRFTNRAGQQAGMLFAGLHSLMSDVPIEEHEAIAMVGEIYEKMEDFDADDTDEIQCLNHLLTFQIKYNGNDRAISAIVYEAKANPALNTFLESNGIKVDDKYLYVAISSYALNKIFKETHWTRWQNSLRRLPDVENSNKYFAKRKQRCLAIPIKYIEGNL